MRTLSQFSGIGLTLAVLIFSFSCSLPEAELPMNPPAAKDASVQLIGDDAGTGSMTDAGNMRCEEPRVQCGSKCVNVLTDSLNCGQCGDVCMGGDYCNDGSCTRTCPSGTVACGSSCVDLASDAEHCGSCDNACASDRECRGGSCNCQQGNIECSGACIDPNSDPNNCGICSRTCESDEICNSGSCGCAGGSRENDCLDGQDNDCDELIDCDDPDCVDSTRSCMGACGPGVETCLSDGQWGMCEGGNGESEICGDGIDQDCDGSDLRMPDSFEPNDTCGLCKYLTATVDPQNESISASFDSVNDDIDCFRFEVVDNGSILGPESISVDLTDIPMGHDYDVYLYRDRTACFNHGTSQAQPLAYSSASSNMPESLRWTERLFVNDSGVYYIIVRRFMGNSCTESYTLTVSGLN